MLIAIYLGIMALLGGAGGVFGDLTTQHVKERIKVHVAEDRQQLALKNLSVVVDDIEEINKQLSKDVKQVEKLVKDYNSTPDEFNQQFATALDKRMQQITKLVSDRKAMLQHITAEEWQTIIHDATLAAERKS